MEVISISRQPIEGGLDQEHVTFLVKLQDIDKAPIISPNQIEVFEPGGDNVICADHICKAFPYHIVFDENLRIKQCGEMIPKILHLRVKVDTPIINVFDIIHPPMKFKLENILTFINSVFYLGVKKNEDQDTRLVLRGKRFGFMFMVFNGTFNNISVISWWLVLLVEETRVPDKNHRPVASQEVRCCRYYTQLKCVSCHDCSNRKIKQL